ncbi:peptide-methionine (R)-S-oxide reductase [Mucilaginibacter hurinus]|uniref:peptide-methionine (R)-S-oxide reductase n=1 Tax=Mucilaginibacter hurinus TaxID=2201324 RepID=A0A367GP52_9SPHI|nr:peptide-methionine (R)-S-oxide reductase MsrB [Mucilaginibacter hurinus]RCH55257.1 peptide-methionine (R)-S-oxide reductase [Mucilaginibacter hurinus]
MRKLITAILFISAVTAVGYVTTNGQHNKKATKSISQTEKAEWKKKLTPEQYHIMVEQGTEPPFKNAYFDNHETGVYVSAATGEVLFSSADKYDSGTGWPSFVKPVDYSKIAIVKDYSFGTVREEVVEKSTGLHLGHVFDDGPAERGGKRYCMNSGALKFIKK